MTLSVIGIMSGSSLDGMDLAHCQFEESIGKINWKILSAQIIHYSESWKNRLQQAPSLSAFDFMKLDAEFGIYIGDVVKDWMDKNKMKVDLIASHGHTVFHEPIQHFTTQIGNGAQIAAITNVDTINDFRQADVARGGHGAPFAPVADRDLFSGYDGYLNLGGIANISLFQENSWNAWDISPCNQALNFLAVKKGHSFDVDGNMSSSGKVLPEVVLQMKKYFPPTHGRAFSLSNATVQQSWLNYLEQSTADIFDLMASTAAAIAELIIDHISSIRETPVNLLATGGGTHNAYLLQQLNAYGADRSFVFEKPEDIIVDFKESLLMAYLGYLSYKGKSFGIRSITGATHDSIGGAYHKALK